jgi:hypothetical protein
MGLRSLEPERKSRARAAHAAHITLAERVLDCAGDFFKDRQVVAQAGDVGTVLYAHYRRIVIALWGIVALAERSLPISALARELLEALVSLAYVAVGQSESEAVEDILQGVKTGPRHPYFQRESAADRARQCIEFAPMQTSNTTMARLQVPMVLGDLQLLLGEDFVKEIMDRKDTWAGRPLMEMTGALEAMAWRDEIPRKVYNTATAYLGSCSYGLRVSELLDAAAAAGSPVPSIGPLPLSDAALPSGTVPSGSSYVEQNGGNLPEQFDAWHLMVACYWSIAALQILGRKLGVDRQSELVMLYGEIESLWPSYS